MRQRFGWQCVRRRCLDGRCLDGRHLDGSVPAGGSLCTDGRSADRVAVSQSNSAHHVTRTSTTQVQALIAAICALPALPAGQPCAASGSVRLVFAAQDHSFPPVTVQQAGCWTVSGLGTTRSWSASSHFGVLLNGAVGGLGRLDLGQCELVAN